MLLGPKFGVTVGGTVMGRFPRGRPGPGLDLRCKVPEGCPAEFTCAGRLTMVNYEARSWPQWANGPQC